jgi:hypothetical protein
VGKKREDSGCILYFNRNLLNSGLHFVCSVGRTGMCLDFQTFSLKINGEDSCQVTVLARKQEDHVRDQSSAWGNFRTASDAFRDCNVMEHRRIKTTCEDAY